jgi:hypothetical protein
MIVSKTWLLKDYEHHGRMAVDEMRLEVERYIRDYLMNDQIVAITGAPCIEFKEVQSGYDRTYRNVFLGDYTVWYRSE